MSDDILPHKAAIMAWRIGLPLEYFSWISGSWKPRQEIGDKPYMHAKYRLKPTCPTTSSPTKQP